jgi:hypothetical protein
MEYSQEFRAKVVERALARKETQEVLAEEYGIGRSFPSPSTAAGSATTQCALMGCPGQTGHNSWVHAPVGIAVELDSRKQRTEQVANKKPRQKGHREGLDQPVHEQGDTDPPDVLAYLVQGAKVHLDQHRDNHHTYQQTNRQVHLSHFQAADGLEEPRQVLSQGNASHDAQKRPDAEVAFEHTHGRADGLFGGDFALDTHGH